MALHPNMRTGYGQAASANLNALRLAGLMPEVHWLVEGSGWGRYLEPAGGAGIRNEMLDVLIVHSVAEYFTDCVRDFPARKRIAVTVWDSETLPATWLPLLNQMDCVVVPCHWNRRTFLAHGVSTRVEVIPHLQVPVSEPTVPVEMTGIPEEDFVFYTIGTWSDRKGTARAVEAFCQAFAGEPRAVLVVKTGKYNELARRWGRWWWHVTRRLDSARKDLERVRRQVGGRARVICLDRDLNDSEVAGIHRRGDCFVSLSRAEGWGMGAFDAAQAGNPVVMPLHGGQAEFLQPDLCYPVRYQLVVAEPQGAIDQEAFAGGHQWAHPDLTHAIEQMREVFVHRAAARNKAAQLAEQVRVQFAPEAWGRRWLELMNSVANS